jgi:hypothetical protein
MKLGKTKMKISKITNSSKEGTLKPYYEGWLKSRFGDHFAQISVVTTLKLKNAVKDVHRAKDGFVSGFVEDLVKRFEVAPQGVDDTKFIFGYDTDEGHVQGSIERDKALQDYIKTYPSYWEVVKLCISLPRQRGRHASAFLVSNKPVHETIPLTTVSGVKVTAFTGPEVEAVGGLKMDWLVVSSLNDIQRCLQIVKQTAKHDGKYNETLDPVSGKLVNIWDLPDDAAVFQDVSCSLTESVFQFCTASAKEWLEHFNYKRPDGTPAIYGVNAMAAFTALDRPGPLNYLTTNPDNPNEKHNMLVEYSRRVRGLEGSKEIPEIIDKLCAADYGIMVFQESVKKVYEELTGCPGVEAEEFRANVGKKKRDKIEAARPFFIERASLKVGEETAIQIFDALLRWSDYGFCRSIDENTLLTLSNGSEKKIKGIVPGDKITGVNAKENPIESTVVALHDHGILDGYKVRFSDGYELVCSENHKFLTDAGQLPIWFIYQYFIPVLKSTKDGCEAVQLTGYEWHGSCHMYDIEVDHPEHNFCLPTGIVTSNSHAVGYATISYACAWLKHYYPLEWWCSVLTFADKDEIGEKFWESCKDFVLLPDVSKSKLEWTIEGDKLRAPLSLLYGVGESAHKELVKRAPYNSLDDLCMAVINGRLETAPEEVVEELGENELDLLQSINNEELVLEVQVAGVKPKKKSKAKPKPKLKKVGRSPITIGTVYSLLAAGALDSIIDTSLTIRENIDIYQAKMALKCNELGIVYTKGKNDYTTPDALGRYMAKKDVIPIFGMDIRPIMDHPDVVNRHGEWFYQYVDWNKSVMGDEKQEIELVGVSTLQAYDARTEFGFGGITCAIVGYVEDCETFTYQKTKTAKKFFLETCGLRREMVRWPDKDGRLPQSVIDIPAGTVVACVIRKYNIKGFGIQDIKVLRYPAEKKVKNEKEND